MKRLWVLGGAVVLTGCGIGGNGQPSRTFNANEGGTPTTITGTDTAGPLFDGEGGQPPACCVKDKIAPFEGLSWFQIVAAPDALGSCPAPAVEGIKAYAEMKPIEPHTCGACSCSAAECTLPEGIHTNAAKCAGADGSISVPLGPDPAAGWAGVCSAEGGLPAGLQCDGAPCAQSVSIPAVAVAPCKPETAPAPPPPDPTWGRLALQCKIDPLSGQGCDPGETCLPPTPDGFELCLYVKGEQPACPADYPAHMVFYTGVKDDRGCEACQCSAQKGAQCKAVFQTFSDAACSALAGAVLVSDQDASCFDVLPGTALASMQASLVTHVPGSCEQSGGAPFGSVAPADPLTLCCQDLQKPPG
jgi:hypothetical protein